MFTLFFKFYFSNTKPSIDFFGIIWWQKISDKSVQNTMKKILKPTGIMFLYFTAYKTNF